MWHVSSRSGVATLRTAIHLLLTYVSRCYSVPGIGMTDYADVRVCLRVCLSASISPELHVWSWGVLLGIRM